MPRSNSVRDILVPLAEYPCISDTAIVRDAFTILREKFATGRRFRHVLVLDAENRLVGLLGIRDLLRAVFPDYLRTSPHHQHQGIRQDFPALSTIWQDEFAAQCVAQAAKPVKPHVAPIAATVTIDDPITKAAYLMVVNDLSMLPVTNGDRVVGVVRVVDIFNETWMAVSGE